MKKTISFLVVLLITISLFAPVYAGSSYVSLSVTEYYDVSSILNGNSARYYNVHNYSWSEYPIYANLFRQTGSIITKVKSVRYNPDGGGTSAWQYATGASW